MGLIPFDVLKQTILQRAGKLEICDAYQYISAATTNTEILAEGCGFYVWAYQADIVDDALLATEFTDEELNSFGIYKNDVTLTNPDPTAYLGCKGPFIMIEGVPVQGQELYFVGSTAFVLNLDNSSENNKAVVNVMGAATGLINLNSNSKLTINLFNTGGVTINNDSSVLCINTNNLSHATINANGTANVYGNLRFKSNITYTADNTSAGRFRLFAKSNIDYNVTFPGFIDVFRYNESTENVFIP